MRNHPFYTGYGLLMVLFAGWANYSGWSFSRVNQLHGVPKSIRDNPGAYRSIYGGYSHYSGGK